MRGFAKNLVLLGIFFASSVQARVLDVHAEIHIAKSGELTVIERITVEGRNQAAAVQRELPPAARVADVIRNGHPEGYALDGARMHLGGAPLPAGRHLYQVTYRAARRIAFLSDHDALHWSLKGGERVTAEVILPAGVPARQIKVEASGSESQSFVRDGRAAFRSRDGLALVVRFPKGVVAEPGIGQRAHWFFSDYFGALLVLAAVGLSAWVLLRLRRISASAAIMLPAIAAALAGPEQCAAQSSQIGVNIYGASYHFERERAKELGLDNEFNPGLGLRYRHPYTERIDWVFDAGIYRDSAGETAGVLGAAGLWKATEHLRLGAALALFKSETYNSGDLALAPVPLAMWEWRWLTINAAYAPRIGDLNKVSTLSFWLTYWP